MAFSCILTVFEPFGGISWLLRVRFDRRSWVLRPGYGGLVLLALARDDLVQDLSDTCGGSLALQGSGLHVPRMPEVKPFGV